MEKREGVKYRIIFSWFLILKGLRMNEEQRAAKLDFIGAFFRDVDKRTGRLRTMIDQGFTEEAVILACCYIDSVAAFRYNKDYADRKDFIRIIFEYSGRKTEFCRISWINLYKRGKDVSAQEAAGKPIAGYEEIKATLLSLYGKECDCNKEMDKEALMAYLRQQGLRLDWKNLESNLDNFSYAAVLFENYRSRGVHSGRIATKWNVAGPVFDKSHDGEDIYYDGNILYFSKEIILEVLTNIGQNLRTLCMDECKFPHEL